jgi:AraC-like DNA-binding protein
VDAGTVFRAAGITDMSQLGLDRRLSLDVLAQVVRRLNRQPGLEGFFPELGATVPVTAHGTLGLAFMACDDLHQVLELLVRFAPLALPGVRVELLEEGTDAVVRVHTSSRYPEFSKALVQGVLAHIVVRSGTLAGRPIVPRAVTLVQRESAGAGELQRWVRAPVTFEAEQDAVIFRGRDLDAKLPTADPVNLRLLRAQCEKELAEVQARTGLADRVREMLALTVAENPSIGQVAERLSLSERTLRRRLREEGVSFRELFKDVRHDLALHYLRDTDTRIQTIAHRLGYRDTACFRQAFKEQEGLSPRQWRRQYDGRAS